MNRVKYNSVPSKLFREDVGDYDYSHLVEELLNTENESKKKMMEKNNKMYSEVRLELIHLRNNNISFQAFFCNHPRG